MLLCMLICSSFEELLTMAAMHLALNLLPRHHWRSEERHQQVPVLLLCHCHAFNVSVRQLETVILANAIDNLAVMPQGGRPSPGAVLRAVTAAAEARAKGVAKKKSPTGGSASATPPPQTPVPPFSPKSKTWKPRTMHAQPPH